MENLDKKTVAELNAVVENYMKNVVNGDDFKDEQDFEDAVRKMLSEQRFEVLPKKNVNNITSMVRESQFSNVDDQIPDIVVNCKEGSVFIELKLRREEADYNSDIAKVKNYLSRKKCSYVGVLFLDDKIHVGWNQCQRNKKYYYLWKIC